jgi:UDP-N-acetylglucosamine transferase subunit ALG13/glycosyltransferase involved in cell wall biosynthesis
VILVTVGSQLPFDRLIEAVDAWAARSGRRDIVAQIGASKLKPAHLEWHNFIPPPRFAELVSEAELIIAHAGMGSILAALEQGKPLIVMPRLAARGEIRTDHQVPTAAMLRARGFCAVAEDELQLAELLGDVGSVRPGARLGLHASPELLEAVRAFLDVEAKTSKRAFDGVICFGGVDWWYHNRGHYDLQMMRELSRSLPVLYVNSLTMRTPRPAEGRIFLRRVLRKLRSTLRGFRLVQERFAVCTVPRLPFLDLLTFEPFQVRRAARRMGIERPLLWVACPPAALLVDRLPHAALVYQRTDRFEAFPGVNPERIRAFDRRLKAEANLTLFCSTLLYEAEREGCRRACLVDHGVDFDLFAGPSAAAEPEDLRGTPRPRVGFVGSIDSHTFDPELLLQVASRLEDCTFILVGASTFPEGWCGLPNVRLLGQRPYEQVAAYMRGCDVLIMPWNQSEWIQACNPVKLKEYLAAGRPVVSTPFAELRRFGDLVQVAADAGEFVAALRKALQAPPDAECLRCAVREETWSRKASQVLEELREAGVEPIPRLSQKAVSSPSSREQEIERGSRQPLAGA